MIVMGTIKEIKKLFTEWNGWGPPTSQYQIHEYCKSQTHSEADANIAFDILISWMNDS